MRRLLPLAAAGLLLVAGVPLAGAEVASAAPAAPVQTITGKVTAAAGGAPLANVQVTTLALDTAKAGPSTTTKADGTYRVSGFRPDTNYRVCFSGTAVPNGPPTGYAKSCLGDGATPIFVLAGRTRTGVNAALGVGGEIDGKVTDAGGNPLAGAAVLIADDNGGSIPRPTGVHTGAAGRYAVRGLAPERYIVCLDPAGATGGTALHGYAPQCVGGYPFDPDNTGAASVPVDPGVVSSLGTLALTAYRWITGKVTGPTGTPMAGVRVTVGNNSVTFRARTGADGKYLVRWEGNDSDTICFTPPLATHLGQRCVEIIPPDARVNAMFVIPPGLSTIAGRVTDAAGHPLPGVVVTSLASVTNDGAVTGADGKYRLGGLADASSDRICFAPGASTQALSQTGYVAKCLENVSHTAGQVKTVNTKLAAGSGISGTVRDATSGTPLPRLLVEIESKDPFGTSGSATTNSRGHYSVKGMPPGDYTLHFVADGAFGQNQSWSFYFGGPSPTGYQDQCWQAVTPRTDPCEYFHVAAGHLASGMDARLRRAGGISGTVTDSAGHPIRHARVDIYQGYGYDDYEYTDANGHYRGVLLPVGGWAVCVAQWFDTTPAIPQGYRNTCYKNVHPPDSAVSVHGGSITPGVNLKLPAMPSGSLTGEVTDDQGEPVAGARVVTDSNSVRTKADGTYVIAAEPTGDVQVCASLPGVATATAPAGFLITCAGSVHVARGAVTSGVDIQLTAAGRIEGILTDSEGAPLRDVAVAAYPSGWEYPLPAVFTDAEGKYSVPDLGDGDYLLEFTPQFLTGTGSSGYGIEDQWSGGVFDRSSAATVAAAAGAVTTYDAQLLEDGSIAGTVLDDAGAPFADVSVTVRSEDGQRFYFGHSGSDGSYVVNALQPGSYTVCFAVLDDSATPYGTTARCHGDTGDGVPAPVTVTGSAQSAGVDGTVVRNGAVKVTVTAEGTGLPVHAYVSTQDAGGNFYSGWTDFDTGVAELVGLPPGDYTLDVDGSSDGYEDAQVMVTVAGAVETTKAVALGPAP